MDDNARRIRDVFNIHAASYRARFWDVSPYTRSLRFFAEDLPHNARVLEVGCGPGNVTAYLLASRSDLAILATDFAPEMVAIAATENPSAKTEVLDVKDMLSVGSDFDGLVCAFVFPYLDAEERARFVSDAAHLLRPGGRLYVSTMVETHDQRSGIRMNSHGEEIYMHYPTQQAVLEALSINGFSILLEECLSYPAADNTTTTDFQVVAQRD